MTLLFLLLKPLFCCFKGVQDSIYRIDQDDEDDEDDDEDDDAGGVDDDVAVCYDGIDDDDE